MTTPLQDLLTLFPQVQLPQEEELQSKALNPLQEINIRNQAIQLVQQIVELTYTPDKPENYGTILAYQQGQLDSLRLLLNQSDEAKIALLRAAQTGTINPPQDSPI